VSETEDRLKHIDALLADYASHHRARGNLVCHVFGVTLILFGITSMLEEFRIGPFRAAEVLMSAVFLYYLTLDLWLAVGMLLAFVVIAFAARAVADWRVGLGAFLVGWIFQAVGHAVYEKNRPAFFRNLVHLLVGPLFLVNELLKVRRVAPLPR
jgi:uncharacterized membrane protein YGL010W